MSLLEVSIVKGGKPAHISMDDAAVVAYVKRGMALVGKLFHQAWNQDTKTARLQLEIARDRVLIPDLLCLKRIGRLPEGIDIETIRRSFTLVDEG